MTECKTGEQLKRRKGKGEKCKYCDALETRNYLFFNCNIAPVIWLWVRISLRWNMRPISINNFQEMMGIGGVIQENLLALVILAAVAWSLWKFRNDWVFNNVLIKSSKSIAYKVVGFLTQWKKMQKEKEKDKPQREDIILKLQEGMRAW